MLKKNMRKRLLAGALATIMALTMCPTWALADDEGITTLPAPEDQMPVVDSTPAEDTIQTPDAGTQGQPEAQDPAQAPSGGTDIEETGNNSSSNENDSQNNDAVSNSPTNTINVQELQSDFARYHQKKAKYFVLLPKRDTPEDNRDQGQENYLPSSNDEAAGIKGSDGGVEGLDADTGYRGYVTAKGMEAIARTKSVTDIKNGVDEEYLSVPENLGFFTAKNWNNGSYTPETNTDETARNALLNTDDFTFTPNGVEIVWYTIKDQSKWDGWHWVEDIHVDGYLKGIPVNVTYYPNYTNNGIFGKNENPIVENRMSGDTYTIRDSNTFEAPEGYSFGGWYTEAACTNEFTDTTTVLMTELHLYAKWVPKQYPYDIEHYKYNPTTEEYEIVEADTETDTAALNETITAKSKSYTGYVLNPHAAGYLASGTVTKNADGTVPKLTLKLFYDPDTKGDSKNPENKGDGIPDRYQYKVTEKVEYGKWDEKKNADDIIFYVSMIDMKTGAEVQPKLTADNIAAVGNTPDAGYQAGYWKDPAPTVGKEITGDVEFTYTYVPVSKYPYAIEHYKYNPATKAYEIVEADTEKDSAVAGTVITATPKNYDGYVLNPHAEGYLASGTVVKTEDSTVPALTLKLFYDPDANGDKIPDRYQYKVTEKVEHGKWDSHTKDAKDIIFYVSTIDMATGAKVEPKLTASNIAQAGKTPDDGYQAGSWDVEPKVDMGITGDTTFTYTYAPVPKYAYVIEHYKYNPDTKEYVLQETEGDSVVAGTEITATPKNYDGYVLNPHAEGYLASGTVIKTEDSTVLALTLKLFYDPDTNGNEIPDSWEYRLTFKVVNGNWNDDTNADVIVYVPFKNADGNAIGNVVIPDGIPTAGEKPAAGYREGKWDTTPVVGATVANDTVFTYTYEKIPDPTKYHYTINKHFYNEKDVEVKVENGETKTGNEYALVAELYKNDEVNQTVDGKNYVYVPGLTKVTDNLKELTKDVTIDLYYYLDVKGGEEPDKTGNGTPDAWEYRLAFKVVNGEWNNGGNTDIVVYVPFKDNKTGDELKYVVVPITSIPAVGDKPNSGYRAGSWDTTPVGNAKVEKDTVFTYTYAKKSSSGGGSHKPTVTIPDDVPTGLNGDDHYAYIVGYPDSTVRPQNGITRAEVATIFFRLLTDETRNANSTKTNSYSDVAAGAWYNHAVSTLSAMGIVKGDSHGKFNPNAPITRAEFAAIAARFDDKADTTAVDFSDIASHWAKDEISAAANNGWINGYTDGTFRPNNKITRAEAMTLVNRVLKRLPETAEDLHNDMIKWSDNSDTSAWYYLAVQEATNSHYYDLKENKHEKWSKLRETRDWTELEK